MAWRLMSNYLRPFCLIACLQLVLCLGSANVLRIGTLNLGGSAKRRKGVEL
jgi:hypothetical protein